MSRGSRSLLGLALLALAGTGVACAPRLAPPRELDIAGRAEKYRGALIERQQRGAAVSASLVLWLARSTERRLPGAQADLALAAPDRVRLRVSSMFGTAVDLSVRGDSLIAYVPAWRTGVRFGAAGDSLGLREPGGLAFRALTGTWEPPAEAWAHAAWRDSVLEVAWVDGPDSMAIGVNGDGLPAWVRAGHGSAPAVTVRYRTWDRTSGIAWPGRIEFEDVTHDIRVVCKATNLRFHAHADPARLVVRMPGNAMALTLADLRAVLGRLGIY